MFNLNMRNSLILIIVFTILFSPVYGREFPQGSYEVEIPRVTGVRTELLKQIAPIVEKSIRRGEYPGAVILAAHRGQLIYRGVFGNRRITPDLAPMKTNTIFDIASLTKVIATTPAIMQLVEQGKLDLDSHVAKYWPQFAQAGKAKITVRQLLTHTSGLPQDVNGDSKNEVLRRIEKLHLQHPPGSHFVYSDVNFIALAHLVEIISGENFANYVQAHLFQPLKMHDTFFLPAEKLKDRIAPTILSHHHLRWGKVQDPIAYAMGGVSGHAGLFSTASDLGIYAQCLLNGGFNGSPKHILSPLTIVKMTTPQTPASISNVRALGWDIDSAYSNRGVLFPTKSFGHTGWTGTSIWIDPVTQTWIIVLTNRVHPTPTKSNQLVQDRRLIANIISSSITDISISSISNTGQGELHRAFPKAL